MHNPRSFRNVLYGIFNSGYGLLIFFILLLGIIGIATAIIYKDMIRHDPSVYSYGLFIGSSIIANTLLAIGRSPVFLIKHPKIKEQEYFYNAAMNFFASSLLAIFASLMSYFVVNYSTEEKLSVENLNVIFIMISIILAFSSFCIIAGVMNIKRFYDLNFPGPNKEKEI